MSSVKHGKTRRRDRENFPQPSGKLPEFDARGTHSVVVIVLRGGGTLTASVVEEFLSAVNYDEVKKYSGKREDLTSVAGRIEAATCGSRKASTGMNLVSVCHLAYYWGSKFDAFRVRVCVRIVCCLSRVCAGHSTRFRSSRAGTSRSARHKSATAQSGRTNIAPAGASCGGR
jgi:hypothetical protein